MEALLWKNCLGDRPGHAELFYWDMEIHPRLRNLRKELLKENIDLDSLRDPWRKQHRFDFRIDANFFAILVTSAGPDGAFSTEEKPSPDGLLVCYSRIQYFQRESAAIDNLRHSLAIFFGSNEVHPSVIQSTLRHYRQQTTARYIHTVSAKQIEARGRYLERIKIVVKQPDRAA